MSEIIYIEKPPPKVMATMDPSPSYGWAKVFCHDYDGLWVTVDTDNNKFVAPEDPDPVKLSGKVDEVYYGTTGIFVTLRPAITPDHKLISTGYSKVVKYPGKLKLELLDENEIALLFLSVKERLTDVLY